MFWGNKSKNVKKLDSEYEAETSSIENEVASTVEESMSKSAAELSLGIDPSAFRAAYDANRSLDESGERLKSYTNVHKQTINNFIDVYSKHFYHLEILQVLYKKCEQDRRTICVAFCEALKPVIESCKNKENLTHTDALLLHTIIETLGLNKESKKFKKSWGNSITKKVGWD